MLEGLGLLDKPVARLRIALSGRLGIQILWQESLIQLGRRLDGQLGALPGLPRVKHRVRGIVLLPPGRNGLAVVTYVQRGKRLLCVWHGFGFGRKGSSSRGPDRQESWRTAPGEIPRPAICSACPGSGGAFRSEYFGEVVHPSARRDGRAVCVDDGHEREYQDVQDGVHQAYESQELKAGVQDVAVR